MTPAISFCRIVCTAAQTLPGGGHKAILVRARPRPTQSTTLVLLLFLATAGLRPFSASAAETFPGVTPAEAALARARSQSHRAPDQAIANYLFAAESALGQEQPSQSKQREVDRGIYNDACAELTALLASQAASLPEEPSSRHFAAPGTPTYHLTQVTRPTGREPAWWRCDYFDRLVPAGSVSHRYVSTPAVRSGWGGSLVAVHLPQESEDDPFMPPDGYTVPVTATLDFAPGNAAGQRRATLSLRDPSETDHVEIGGQSRPLSGDFTAPINYHRSKKNPTMEAVRGVFRMDRFHLQAHLYFLQPYRPDRIPVVFVHGFISSPLAFVENGARLLADPLVHRRYQLGAFSYPTGGPMLLSAYHLRLALGQFKALCHPPHGYVLIGHSQGGLLCRLQVTDSKRIFWDHYVGKYADYLDRHAPKKCLARQVLVFRPDPAVRRVVFICTPHRGSEKALGFWPRMGARLIAVPKEAHEEALRMAALLPDHGAEAERVRHPLDDKPTIIGGLSPHAPFFQLLAQMPVRAPFHSIIGDRGLGGSPDSSDGTVPYRSSHLAGARSERILPIAHSTYNQPVATAEMDRILHVDAGH